MDLAAAPAVPFRVEEKAHRLVLSSPERFKRSVGSYHDFVDACEAHDPDRAERVIHDSMRWAVDLIAGSLPSESDLR